MLLVDDSLFFFHAEDVKPPTLKYILDTYGLASGQMINLQKSKNYFSRNLHEDLKAYAC